MLQIFLKYGLICVTLQQNLMYWKLIYFCEQRLPYVKHIMQSLPKLDLCYFQLFLLLVLQKDLTDFNARVLKGIYGKRAERRWPKVWREN